MSLRTPLARARGLGSAKEGTQHWWLQRVTAIALVPLTLWFVISMMFIATADYATVVAWFSQVCNSAVMIFFVLAMLYHACLGLQVVLEDYVHDEGLKLASLLAVKFLSVLLAITAIVAVIRIASGGAHV